MAGRREGWRTAAWFAWSVAARLLSVDDLAFVFILSSPHPTLKPKTTVKSYTGAFNGCADRSIQSQPGLKCWCNFKKHLLILAGAFHPSGRANA